MITTSPCDIGKEEDTQGQTRFVLKRKQLCLQVQHLLNKTPAYNSPSLCIAFVVPFAGLIIIFISLYYSSLL